MLLFEHKQYLQICGAESSMQMKISYVFKNCGSLMPTKTTGRGLQRAICQGLLCHEPR